MVYKLSPIVERISSPVILRFQDGNNPDSFFESGAALASEAFDRPYLIVDICANNSGIILSVKENDLINSTEWAPNSSTINFF